MLNIALILAMASIAATGAIPPVWAGIFAGAVIGRVIWSWLGEGLMATVVVLAGGWLLATFGAYVPSIAVQILGGLQ